MSGSPIFNEVISLTLNQNIQQQTIVCHFETKKMGVAKITKDSKTTSALKERWNPTLGGGWWLNALLFAHG